MAALSINAQSAPLLCWYLVIQDLEVVLNETNKCDGFEYLSDWSTYVLGLLSSSLKFCFRCADGNELEL